MDNLGQFKYSAVIRPLNPEEGGGYLFEAIDLPGCMADGETIEEALREGADAIIAWIKADAEFAEEIRVSSCIKK
jgi:antitoxin HicB